MSDCYIFGYGSLINADSRAKTGITGEGLPVIVKGIKRSWWVPEARYDMASVGVTKQDNASCNGVLFAVDKKELPSFDERESGYFRESLPVSNIEFLLSDTVITEDIWVYYINQTILPNQKQPIVQSYLDVILQGCLEIGAVFTSTFLKTTDNWKTAWSDDREDPVYPRYSENSQNHDIIDRLIYPLISGVKCQSVAS